MFRKKGYKTQDIRLMM